ncbi:MAG: glycerophosphodiester phosphodiesterase [Chloroflexi bacterium]|nr:glycerophosphodiester phosphodiesterase [Chloroflexota bacterium]
MPRRTEWRDKSPLVIAHRGASAYAPENTLAAFRLAEELGAQAIELDVKLTKDERVVVLHDATLERTTSGRGPLSKFSYEEIKHLDAGSSFGPTFAKEIIPTLEQVFIHLGSGMLINIELTNYANPFDALPAKVVEIVRRAGNASQILFSSFSVIALIRARRMAPEIPTGLLVRNSTAMWLTALMQRLLKVEYFHPQDGMVTARMLDKIRNMNMAVNVWTVNDQSRMRTLLDMGVAGLITDEPEVALQTLQ